MDAGILFGFLLTFRIEGSLFHVLIIKYKPQMETQKRASKVNDLNDLVQGGKEMPY
jgi:hypothetical protein